MGLALHNRYYRLTTSCALGSLKPKSPAFSPRERFEPLPRRRIILILSRSFISSSPSPIMADSSSTPATSQLVQHRDREYMAIKEGLAYILNPPAQDAASRGTRRDLKDEDESQSVFYNPIQQFNRDLSVLAIRAFGEHAMALKKQKAEKKKSRKNGGNGPTKGKKRKRADEESTEQKDEVEKVAENGNTAAPVSESQPEQKIPPSFTILDALSATGLRALRYASEIPFTTCVVANDFSPSAIASMKNNIEYNKLERLIRPNTGDARAYMYNLPTLPNPNGETSNTGKFDVIDLDPYGSAAPFMDAAVQGVKDGGLLCVTCTDAGVWASNGYPEKAFALYGGVPLKGTHSHEAGLRLILHGLATSAAKYGLAIEPLLSLSIDFYARVFVRVHRSPAEVKFVSGNTMMVYNCDAGCGAWSTQPLSQTRQRLDKKGSPFYHYSFSTGPVAGPQCNHCGFKTHLGGPMWGGPLHNPHFIQKILDMLPGADRDIYHTVDRIEGMLTTALEEDLDLGDTIKTSTPDKADAVDQEPEHPEYAALVPRVDPALRDPHPFYFSLSGLSKVIHTSTMPIDTFRGAIRSVGYRSTRSHTKPNTIRTDAPWEVIWEVMREWVRQKSPIKQGALRPGTAGAAIMEKSRENLENPAAGEDELLSQLRKEIMSAVDDGKDIIDLVTKVEAALYRSGCKQALGQSSSETQDISPAKPHKGSSGRHGGSSRSTLPTGPDPSTLEIVFDEALGKEESAAHTKKRLVRYQINPRANWGPLNRASGGPKA